ncbi:MAG: hypothetical protein QOG67_1705 [Verrucomicrobiota bacterium]|jgi:hypothetical protein
MPDSEPLPQNVNYIFVQAPITLDKLKNILIGIESNANQHPVDASYPTNSWVTHVYAAVTVAKQQGYAILYDIPPVDDTGANPVQVAAVTGNDDKEKAEKASILIGRGNELIGYEDVAGPQRVVIFRTTQAVIPSPSVPDSLSWDNLAERREWSAKLIALTNQNRADLDKGNPEGFIPGYNALPSDALKIKFWAETLVAMANFESGWNPKNVYGESFNVNSVGLLQLSLQDQNNYHLNPHINSEEDLKKPLVNLEWGVTIFGNLLARDGIVASGSGNNSRGAARYWSVLRAGHKIDLIKALTKKNVGL